MSTLFSIAGVQRRVSATFENVAAMEAQVNVLMDIYPWVEMVMFSELAPLGPLTAKAQEFPNKLEDRFRALAKKHKIWLLPGTMFERKDGHIYNTATVINPDGEIVGRYRKMFPFYPYEEGVEPGDEFLTFDVPDIGRFGVSICYDMWFPETSRTLAAMGAEVILHPTLTPSTDREIELAIARSTAAQQQCFFFDVNGIGDGGIGRSIVIGPHGDVLHQCGTGEEVFPIEIDLDQVRHSRERGLKGLGQTLKSFRDRKIEFDVYDSGWSGDGYLSELGPILKPGRKGVNSPLVQEGSKAEST